MIYYLDFGSLRYPMPMHNRYRNKYGKKFYTIKNYIWTEKGLMLVKAKDLWLVKKVAFAKVEKIIGDILCMPIEAFQEVVNEYRSTFPANTLFLESIMINDVRIYYMYAEGQFIGGMPTMHEDVLMPANMQGRGYDLIKLGNYDKNISIYEN